MDTENERALEILNLCLAFKDWEEKMKILNMRFVVVVILYFASDCSNNFLYDVFLCFYKWSFIWKT